MNRFFERSGMAFAVLLAAATTLDAQAQSATLPAEHQEGVASYVSGGVGDGQEQQFQSAFKQYPLVVKLFEGNGTARAEFTAEARVRITDGKGATVLDAKSDGPYMLVRLPAGDYDVVASLDGKSLPGHKVHVTASGHVVTTFLFPKNSG